MRFLLPRLLGVATAAYGVTVFAKPALLLGPSGMRREDHDLDAVVRTFQNWPRWTVSGFTGHGSCRPGNGIATRCPLWTWQRVARGSWLREVRG
jgi:hypothetical protein